MLEKLVAPGMFVTGNMVAVVVHWVANFYIFSMPHLSITKPLPIGTLYRTYKSWGLRKKVYDVVLLNSRVYPARDGNHLEVYGGQGTSCMVTSRQNQ